MKPSEKKKIYTEMMTASDQTKFRICQQLLTGKYITLDGYCPSEECIRFRQYYDKADFDGAISYLHDTILPLLKKRKNLDHDIILSSVSIALSSGFDIKPNQRQLIEDVIEYDVIPPFLKKVKTELRKGRHYIYKDDLLYMLQLLCQQEKLKSVPNLKEALFHLLSQILAKRDLIIIYRDAMVESIQYLQSKYDILDLAVPSQKQLLSGKARRADFQKEWDEYVQTPKTGGKPRITLDDVARMLSEMDERHAEEVHHLFMTNYIDYSDYEFRDEWMIDGYLECHHEYFRSCGEYLNELNNYVIEILKEWKQDANYKYQKAKKDLVWWMEDPIPEFKPSLEHEIDTAIKRVSEAEDDEIVVKALMPFPQEIAKIINARNYEDAAANIYYLFDYLAAFEKKHEPWFKSIWEGGPMSKMACFFDVLCELYCHLRQLKDVPLALRNEMDIHLEIFNRKTYFFGDMCFSSRFEDMVLDGKEQFNDYSVLEECSMWRSWYLSYGKQSNQVLEN